MAAVGDRLKESKCTEEDLYVAVQALYLDEVYPQDAWELRPTPKEHGSSNRKGFAVLLADPPMGFRGFDEGAEQVPLDLFEEAVMLVLGGGWPKPDRSSHDRISIAAWLHQREPLQKLTLGKCLSIVNLLLASHSVIGKRQGRLVELSETALGYTSLGALLEDQRIQHHFEADLILLRQWKVSGSSAGERILAQLQNSTGPESCGAYATPIKQASQLPSLPLPHWEIVSRTFMPGSEEPSTQVRLPEEPATKMRTRVIRVESTNTYRSNFERANSTTTGILYHELQVDSSQTLLTYHGFERASSKGSYRHSELSTPALSQLIWAFLQSSWKAVLTTLVALLLAAGIHFAMPSVHPNRYIIMSTTVVDYPAAFEVPSEYHPACDARSPDFTMGNRDYLEGLKDFSFVFLSVASIVNMLTEIIKTASAVLMPPSAPPWTEDNLNAFFRGSEGARRGRVWLTVACGVAVLPKLLIFLPALLVTFLIGLVPTWIASAFLEWMTGKAYWQKDVTCFICATCAQEHQRHFLKAEAVEGCRWCNGLVSTATNTTKWPSQAFVYDGLQECWEFPCLSDAQLCSAHHFIYNAQRGGTSAAELLGVLRRLRSRHSVRALRVELDEAQDFAEGLQQAEQLRRLSQLKQRDDYIIVIDGVFGLHTKKALMDFLSKEGELPKTAATLQGNWGQEGRKALQSYLKKNGFYTAWLTDNDTEWGRWTTIALQRFLLAAHEKAMGIRHLAVDGQWNVETEFLARSGTASPRTGTWQAANTKAMQEFLKRRGYLEQKVYEIAEDLEENEEVVCDTRAVEAPRVNPYVNPYVNPSFNHFNQFMNPHYAGLNPLLPFPPHVGGPGAPSLVHRAPAPGVPGFGPALPAGAVVRPPPSHWAPGPSGPTGPPLPPKVRLRQFDGHPEVWVYEQPNRFRQIGAIPNGTLVEFLGEEGSFRRIRCGKLDGWVGSKNVVFRGGTDAGYPFLPQVVRVPIISAAMPNCNRQVRDAPVDAPPDATKYQEMILKKFDTMLGVAFDALGRTGALVLPDLGCGAYGNDPSEELLVEDNPNVEVNGIFDLATKQGLQNFLRMQGRYVSFIDGDFGAVSVLALQAWLRDEGFSCGRDGPRGDGVSGVWGKAARSDGQAACWALALYGGAEDWIDEDVFDLLPVLDGNLIESGRGTAKARQVLRENGLPVPPEWWGTAQLLANLGDAAWIQAAGSEAAVAAVLSLRSLEFAEEAPSGVWEMGVAALLGHLRDGLPNTVEVVCFALGKLTDMHVLRVEVHDCTRKVLASRLRANGWIHQAIAGGLTAMPTLVAQLWPVLRERLSSTDGLDVKIAAEALAALDQRGLLAEHVLTSSAEILGPRFQDEESSGTAAAPASDWIVRLGACHGLASFGMKIAGPYLDQMLRLVDDDEGPVVAAAAAAVSRLLQDKPERRFQLYGVIRRLQARLPIEEGDPWVRAGCCQGIGSIGLSIEETVQVLSKHLTDTEVIVVEAAAEALRRLRDSGAIAGKVLEDEAKEGASRLLSSEWLSRWAACVCLGALGSAALPYIQDRLSGAPDWRMTRRCDGNGCKELFSASLMPASMYPRSASEIPPGYRGPLGSQCFEANHLREGHAVMGLPSQYMVGAKNLAWLHGACRAKLGIREEHAVSEATPTPPMADWPKTTENLSGPNEF
eukprot:g13244.t1